MQKKILLYNRGDFQKTWHKVLKKSFWQLNGVRIPGMQLDYCFLTAKIKHAQVYGLVDEAYYSDFMKWLKSSSAVNMHTFDWCDVQLGVLTLLMELGTLQWNN